MSERRAPRTGVLVLAVIVIAIAAYIPSLPGGWIYDDHTLIADNPHAHSLSEWRSWITQDFWHADADAVYVPRTIRYWRPLISATYAVDWTIGGGSPVWFHFMNLVLQGAVAALAFFTLKRWIGSNVPAALAAALFCVHPTKAESVAWISGRTDIICMLAILVAIAGVARRLRKQRGGLVLEILGTIAAYLSKEQAIVLFVFVVVEVWVAADRPPLDLSFVKRAVRACGPQLALALAYLVTRALVLPVSSATDKPPLGEHVLAVLESMGRYFALLVAPIRLSIQQGLSYGPLGSTHSWGHIVLGGVGIAAFIALALRYRVRRPAVCLGIILFGVTIAPTSNLMLTGMLTLISERFLYLPFIGIAWLLGDLAASSRSLRIALVIVTVLFAVQSSRRSGDYADEESFWGRELTINPQSREARQYRVVIDMQNMRYRAALRELGAYLVSTDRQSVQLESIIRLAEINALLLPDSDVTGLRAVDAFVDDVIHARNPARLAVNGTELQMDPRTGEITKMIKERGYRLWALRASIASRLGDQAAAARFNASAAQMCAACASTLTSTALVLARSGEEEAGLTVLERGRGTAAEEPLENARAMLHDAIEHRDHARVLTGAAAADERAAELAALESWEASYQVLAPYEAQLAREPALRFAEIAFRAGHADVARRTIERVHGPNVDEAFAEWSAGMGWRE